MNSEYTLITIQRSTDGAWRVWGHRNLVQRDLLNDAIVSRESAILSVQYRDAPIMFANNDSTVVQRYLAVIGQIDILTQEVKDLEARYGAEQEWSKTLKAALDADPIQQAQKLAETLGYENDALRHDNAELQRALDGGLVNEVNILRLEKSMMPEYTQYVIDYMKDWAGDGADDDYLAVAPPLTFEQWLDDTASDGDSDE